MKTHKVWNVARTDSGAYQVDLFGMVGGSKAWGDGFNENEFLSEFRAIPPTAAIEMSVNSPGGSVFTALSIVSLLAQHKAPVTIRVNGLAASAATIITSAPNAKVIMPRGSMMMIHRASSMADGNADELRSQADTLEKIEENIVQIYRQKTGKSEAKIREAMEATTWLNAEEAVKFGLADEVDESATVEASLDGSSVVVNGLAIPKDKLGMPDRFFSAAAQSVPAAVKKEDPKMDLETLKAEHKDLYSAIRAEAFAAGRKAERERLSGIEAVALAGYEDLVAQAKADESMTAEALAVAIVKAEKGRASQVTAKVEEDAKALAEKLSATNASEGNKGVADGIHAARKAQEDVEYTNLIADARKTFASAIGAKTNKEE